MKLIDHLSRKIISLDANLEAMPENAQGRLYVEIALEIAIEDINDAAALAQE